MGIIDFIKGRSPKDIRLKQDISQYLVFPYLLKKKRIWIDKKAVVPENMVLIIATKGKVLDILPTGEHKLTAVTLPNSSNKFKLYKADKNGNPPTNFKAYSYFINTADKPNFKFSTYKKITYENELDGKFWVRIDFEIDLKVADPKKFLKSLMCEYSYLKIGEAEEILKDWLSEFVTTELEKTPYRKNEFEEKSDEITARLQQKLNKLITDVGLEQSALKIAEINYSKDKNKNKNPLIADSEEEHQREINYEELEAKRIYADEQIMLEQNKQEKQLNPYVDPHLDLSNQAEVTNERFEVKNIEETEKLFKNTRDVALNNEYLNLKEIEKNEFLSEKNIENTEQNDWNGLEKL